MTQSVYIHPLQTTSGSGVFATVMLLSETLIEDAILDTDNWQNLSDSRYVEAIDVAPPTFLLSLDAEVMPRGRI